MCISSWLSKNSKGIIEAVGKVMLAAATLFQKRQRSLSNFQVLARNQGVRSKG